MNKNDISTFRAIYLNSFAHKIQQFVFISYDRRRKFKQKFCHLFLQKDFINKLVFTGTGYKKRHQGRELMKETIEMHFSIIVKRWWRLIDKLFINSART